MQARFGIGCTPSNWLAPVAPGRVSSGVQSPKGKVLLSASGLWLPVTMGRLGVLFHQHRDLLILIWWLNLSLGKGVSQARGVNKSSE